MSVFDMKMTIIILFAIFIGNEDPKLYVYDCDRRLIHTFEIQIDGNEVKRLIPEACYTQRMVNGKYVECELVELLIDRI